MSAARYVGARGTTKYTTEYTGFRGVDFASYPGKVDSQHSPDALNIMVDDNGALQKRPGWRVLYEYGSSRIWGIHRLSIDGQEQKLLVHCGDKIYLHGTTPELLYEGVNSAVSCSVVCNGKLWILTGREYLVFDGETVQRVRDIAYTPTIKIACTPATGAGTALEPVNMLTDKRIIRFIGDGTSTVFMVDDTGYDGVDSVLVNDEPVSFTKDKSRQTITLSSAPPKPDVTGQDNVTVTYRKNIVENLTYIEGCRIMGLYGLGGADSDRIFFAGNPEKKNVDWHCEIAADSYNVDPTYVPDTSFAYIGSDDVAIMGYRRLGSYQLIIKAQNAQDASVFLRSYGIDDEGTAYFNIQQGAAGIGAAALGAFANLGDEPLFLSEQNGICGIATSAVTNTTSIQNRSWFLDRRLRAEGNLSEAVAVGWQGKYLLAANKHVYVLDSRLNKTYKERSGGSYVYEAFYWEGVPAVCFCEAEGELYFGTDAGQFCRFNTDVDSETMYRDIYSTLGGGERAIEAYWTTPWDDDSYPTRSKTINSNWLAVQSSDTISALTIAYRRDDVEEWSTLREYSPTLRFSFDFVDFSTFNFTAGKQQWTIPIHSKIKKYLRLQFKISNAELGQGFSLTGIVKSFIYGDFNKIS